MPVAVRKYYSEEDFLILERMSKIKNEYYRGEIFAMSGASFQHNQIASILLRDIGMHLKDKACDIFGSDLRVHAWLQSFYTYPDAVIFAMNLPLLIKRLIPLSTRPSFMKYCLLLLKSMTAI